MFFIYQHHTYFRLVDIITTSHGDTCTMATRPGSVALCHFPNGTWYIGQVQMAAMSRNDLLHYTAVALGVGTCTFASLAIGDHVAYSLE